MSSSAKLPGTFHVTSKIDFTKSIDRSSLKNQSVLVTGGASGIGLGCATAFAEAGAHVTILDINDSAGTAAASTLTTAGHNVHFHKTDVTSWASQVEGFKAAITSSPTHSIDIVVASAGLPNTRASAWLASQPTDPPQDPAPPNMNVVDVGFTGYMYTAHLALHYFKMTASPTAADKDSPPRNKQLILLCSTLGYTSTTDALDYTAAKYAVRGLWKSIRYMPHILSPNPTSPDPSIPLFRTNLVAPAIISTPMTAHVEGAISRVLRVGTVADVVEAVVRVAVDEDVHARAVCVPPGSEVPGDGNFDLEDDWEGLEGGALVGSVNGGSLKGLELFCRPV